LLDYLMSAYGGEFVGLKSLLVIEHSDLTPHKDSRSVDRRFRAMDSLLAKGLVTYDDYALRITPKGIALYGSRAKA
jgi:hypothetical protein